MKWPGRVLLAAVLLTAVAARPSLAQAPGSESPSKPAETSPSAPSDELADQLRLTRASIQTHRQAIVTEAMDLDERQTQTFWPLYRDYRLAMAKVDDRLVRLLGRYLESYPNLSEATAGQLLDETLSIEEARNQVRREWVSRFRKVLPDRTVARFFQIERKLDAIVTAELAERVPLVE